MYLIVAVVIVIAPLIDELLMLGEAFDIGQPLQEGGCKLCQPACLPSTTAQLVACIVYDAYPLLFLTVFNCSPQPKRYNSIQVNLKKNILEDAALCNPQPSGKSKSETFSSWVIMGRISLVQCGI